MDTYTIDIEMEHYYGDRMANSNREACRRLYVRAVSRFNGADLEKYIRRLQDHASAYASISHVLQSPFRHVQTPLFLSSLVLFIASLIMVFNGATTVIVAAGLAAGMVGMFDCARKLCSYWLEYSIREAVFLELAESLRAESM